ncbi:hypothetical protein [uncultured Bartonella sp.]|uniref:hypothetical protein n=1 Tax=uncultured Bartonella sp. TaxID=104108 RepID=UPI0025F3E43F|nr:hypothetical protein [uncultured Bartonella sp.]
MKNPVKILVLSFVCIAAGTAAPFAKDTINTHALSMPSVRQTLPAMPKLSAPKTENIVFKPYAGIDPIVTGPRS